MLTLCDGKPFAAGNHAGCSEIDERARRLPMAVADLSPQEILDACHASGVTIRMVGIVPQRDDAGQDDGEPPALAALVSRDGRSIVGATLRGLAVEAIATSHTGARDILLVGRDAAELATAYATVARMGGGMACPGATLPLPIFGYVHPGTTAEAARELVHFERVAGVPAGGLPFPFVTLFLTLPALPGLCLTTDGVLDVKAREYVSRPRPLEPVAGAPRPQPGAR